MSYNVTFPSATRTPIVGKQSIFVDKKMGFLYFDKVEIKGNPDQWVREALPKHSNERLGEMLSSLSVMEEYFFPFTPGKKMGRLAFWRNAYQYFINNHKKK